LQQGQIRRSQTLGYRGGLVLSVQERAQLDQVSMLPLLYPYWHQAASVAERLGPADLALLQPYL